MPPITRLMWTYNWEHSSQGTQAIQNIHFNRLRRLGAGLQWRAISTWIRAAISVKKLGVWCPASFRSLMTVKWEDGSNDTTATS